VSAQHTYTEQQTYPHGARAHPSIAQMLRDYRGALKCHVSLPRPPPPLSLRRRSPASQAPALHAAWLTVRPPPALTHAAPPPQPWRRWHYARPQSPWRSLAAATHLRNALGASESPSHRRLLCVATSGARLRSTSRSRREQRAARTLGRHARRDTLASLPRARGLTHSVSHTRRVVGHMHTHDHPPQSE
jgi:hypothetical protein